MCPPADHSRVRRIAVEPCARSRERLAPCLERPGAASISVLRRVAEPPHLGSNDVHRARRQGRLVVYESAQRRARDCSQLANANISSPVNSAPAKSRPTRISCGTTMDRPGPRSHDLACGRRRVLIMQNGNPATVMIVNSEAARSRSRSAPDAKPARAYTDSFATSHDAGGHSWGAPRSRKSPSTIPPGRTRSVPAASAWRAVRLKNWQHPHQRQPARLRARSESSRRDRVGDHKTSSGITLHVVQEVTRLRTATRSSTTAWQRSQRRLPKVVQLIEVAPTRPSSGRCATDTLGPRRRRAAAREPGRAEKRELQR